MFQDAEPLKVCSLYFTLHVWLLYPLSLDRQVRGYGQWVIEDSKEHVSSKVCIHKNI
jgi:hypothetical protein